MGDDPPSLKWLALSQCIRFSAMIDDIGEMSYGLVRPLLAKMSPTRLAAIEQAHPRIAAESDELWRDIIKREFPGRPLPQEDFRQTYRQLLEDKESQLDAARERLIRKQKQYENDRRQSAVITLTEAPRQRRRVSGFTPQRSSIYRSRSMQLVAKQMNSQMQLHRSRPQVVPQRPAFSPPAFSPPAFSPPAFSPTASSPTARSHVPPKPVRAPDRSSSEPPPKMLRSDPVVRSHDTSDADRKRKKHSSVFLPRR